MTSVVAIVYANLKGNLGDFAILQSMMMDILRVEPACQIHVYSQPFVSVDEERLEAFKRLAPAFEFRGTMQDDPNPLSPLAVRTLRAIGLLRPYQERRISRLARLASAPFAAQFKKYDAVYLAGGAQWTGINAAASMYANLRAIAEYNTNIHTYPISVSSSFRKVNSRRSMAGDFNLIRKPIIARDSGTQAALQELGLDVVLGADCVFALASVAVSEAAAVKAGRRALFVLTDQSSDDIIEAVGAAKAAGFNPALLTTCDVEDGKVQRSAAASAGFAYIAPLTWQDAVAEMNASSVVVTNRLHGLILSSFSAACAVPLVDRQKVRAVVRDVGLPVSIETLRDLNEATLLAAETRHDEIRQKLGGYRDGAAEMVWSPLKKVK